MTTTIEVKKDLKEAIVTMLKEGQQIGMNCDLACYPSSDGFYQVDYLYSKETMNLLNLTEQERKTILDDEELVEIFETAEEAAEFYLRLSYGTKLFCPENKKRTLKEKVGCYEKDKYF